MSATSTGTVNFEIPCPSSDLPVHQGIARAITNPAQGTNRLPDPAPRRRILGRGRALAGYRLEDGRLSREVPGRLHGCLPQGTSPVPPDQRVRPPRFRDSARSEVYDNPEVMEKYYLEGSSSATPSGRFILIFTGSSSKNSCRVCPKRALAQSRLRARPLPPRYPQGADRDRRQRVRHQPLFPQLRGAFAPYRGHLDRSVPVIVRRRPSAAGSRRWRVCLGRVRGDHGAHPGPTLRARRATPLHETRCRRSSSRPSSTATRSITSTCSETRVRSGAWSSKPVSMSSPKGSSRSRITQATRRTPRSISPV